MVKGDSLLIKRLNQMAILRFIQQNEPTSRHEIGQACGLASSTVSTLVAELVEIGIVKHLGEGQSIGGRRPVTLGLNEGAGHVIAVDVGSTTITCGRVDLHARIHDKLAVPTPRDPEESVAATVQLVEQVHQQALLHDSPPIIGVGVATTGYVHPSSGIVVRASNLGWYNVDLKKEILAVTGLPTLVDNNTNAAALGELYYGSGAGTKNFIYVAIGNGIGAGLVLDGQLFRGTRNGAGEIGHTTIVADGPRCACGRVGCLEAVASGSAIERIARTAAAESPVLRKHRRRGKLTAEDVFRYAMEGDAASLAIVDSALTYLADAISNLVNLLNPDRVILGGGLTRSGEFFMDRFLAKVKPRLLPDQNGHVGFGLSESNEDSGLRGAATLVLQQLFDTGRGIDSGADHTQHPNGRARRVPTVQDLILQ